MRKIFYLILFLILFFEIGYSQNYNWITPNQTYLKLYINDDGIYRINKVDFTSAGINTSTIDPRTVKVYYKGNQIPIYFQGEGDGTFNDNDYFDFYGQRNYGGLTNTYDGSNNLAYVTNEYYNLYSDTSVYWIGWGGANGLRFANFNYSTTNPYNPNYYYEKLHFEKNLIYTLGESTGGTDYRYFSVHKFLGEGWYWFEMQYLNTITETFSVPFVSTSPQPCSLRIFAYPANRNTSIYNEHKLVIKVNGNLIDTLMTNDFNKLDTTVYFPSSLLTPGSTNNFSVQYRPPSSFSDGKIFFDLLEISYPHRFEFENNELSFNTNNTDTLSKRFSVTGYNSSDSIYLYDIANGLRITNQSSTSGTLFFTGKGNGKFKIVNKYITKKPFRIKQKQVPNLVSTSNGADYLIIYNKLFETQAELLRSHRNSHDGFRSVKAEIEDLYDIFNYGIEGPVAVRNFIKYVYDNWQLPKVQYVCLFGRGSLDPKKYLTSSIYYKNLVPVYGNPSADGYFANLNIGAFTYYHQISIGRLPAYTNTEAQNIVNKIIAYDNNSLGKWIKEPIFITGGFERSEQIIYINQSNVIINNYINPPPISSNTCKIYRYDSTGYISFNFQDSVENSINRGGLLVNYIGHAGSSGFEDPNSLSNGNKLPLVLSMTCFTGINAEANGRSLSEQFMYLQNKGSLGFIGSTGWSYSGSGNTYNNYLLKGFSEDDLRRIGSIVKYATELMSPDSLTPAARNTINCYGLIGDPASKLLLPVYPEFDIQQEDYILSNSYPSINEYINLKIFPKNLGTYADSCKIRFQLIKNNQNYLRKDTILYNFRFVDTVNYVFKLDTTGTYLMNVFLDSDNWYTQELGTNNEIAIILPLRNISYVPLKPVDNSIIRNDTVEFVGLNPNIDRRYNTVNLLLELDTTKQFNSPLNQIYFNNNITGVVTKFKVRMPILDTNIVFYWRMNAIINNDSTGWSAVRRFIYNPFITYVESMKHRYDKIRFQQRKSGVDNLDNFDSIISVYKKHAGQYSDYDFGNTMFDKDSIKTKKYTGNLFARSLGGFWWVPTYFLIDDMEFYLIDPSYWGLNIGKVRKINGKLIDVKNFRMTSPLSSDSIVNYLNPIDSNFYIMMAITQYFVGDSLRQNAKNKIKEFGSVMIDSVRGYLNSYPPTNSPYQTWCMIGYRGAPPSSIPEDYHPNIYSTGLWLASECSMQPEFQSTYGTVTHRLGPAQTWKNFSWDGIVYPNSEIKFDVIGIDRNDQEVMLIPNVTSNFVNLESINAYQYPNMKLITKLSIDTISGYQSPVFKSLKFNYIPPAELVVDVNSLVFSDSVINEGDSLKLSVDYYNVGFRNLDGHTINWYTYNGGQKVILKSDTIPGLFKIDSMKFSKDKMVISSFNFGNKVNDLVSLDFETIPLGYQNDYYSFNNSTNAYIVIKNSPRASAIDVFSDGVKLIGGDYVRTKPEILINVTSADSLGYITNDTTILKVILNNNYIPYNIGDAKNPILQLHDNNIGAENIKLHYYPTLLNGENELKFILRKATTNLSDTVSYNVFVTNELLIKDLYNFPNPMKNQTSFIFNLAGSEQPAECRIKIYSVSGRLIKEIHSHVNIGFNQIYWNGRDSDSDAIANGVYLYKMIIEGNAKTETSIQKLVVLR